MSALPPDVAYRALSARDRRFDGTFVVGVSTTGIYCRPVCPARTPRRDRCTFYPSAVLAERAGFRACFRCRPERAPGGASVDRTSALAAEAARRIEEGALDDAGLPALARALGVGERHLRRTVEKELGVSPIELALSRRLATARLLVDQRAVGLAKIAFASGFSSVRRFNDAFRRRFGAPPSRVRAAGGEAPLVLTLGYRPPLAWDALLGYLGPRAIAGLERVEGGRYHRLVRTPRGRSGWLVVEDDAARSAVRVQLDVALVPELRWLVPRLRALLDLDARPDVIAEALGPLARGEPGLRVPGCLDPFELAVRAVLGQQISVAGATTLAGRLVGACGAGAFPTAHELARLGPARIAAIGLPTARATTLATLSRAVADGGLLLETAPHPELVAQVRARLEAIDGIGAWTSGYVALRALRDPDAFLPGDLGVRKALGRGAPISERDAARRGERFRPFRAYAVLHLWRSLSAARSTSSDAGSGTGRTSTSLSRKARR